ncbi:glycosyltransferase family protein [bacterium]|nr:glycosyltransferase family protein [bacterium]
MAKKNYTYSILTTTFFLLFCLTIHTEQELLNKDFRAYFNQANEFFKQNNIDDAIIYYSKTIAANERCHQAYFNRGYAFEKKGNNKEAQKNYKKSLELNPGYIKARRLFASTLKKEGKLNQARQEYEIILQSNPNDFESLREIARIFSDMRNFEKAIHYFEKALEVNPENIQCQLDYANTLNMSNSTEEALKWYYKLSKRIPESASLTYNIAYTLKKLGRIQEAFEYYDRTLVLNPNHTEGHFGRGVSLLMVENFKEGWEEYEWRWNRKRNNKRTFNKPLWDGSDLHGKTIYLYAEQGLGDTFQFCRLAQEAKDRGGFVIVAVQNPLVTILSSCPFIDRIISLNDPIPHFDTYAPLMSLPLILGLEVKTIPTNIPYIFAKENLIEHWKKQLSSDKNFKIGICWQGNPNYSTPFLRNAVAAKSIDLIQMADIARIEGVSLYCLQKTTGEEQLKNLPDNFNLHIFGPDFDSKTKHGRFMDTAAVMKNLDLIITVDTSIGHIAGGLGVPVWLMLPEPADWRWMLRKFDTPWYPNVRMFRQPKPDDWASVIQEMVYELTKKLQNTSTAQNQNSVPQKNNSKTINTKEFIQTIVALETTLQRTNDYEKQSQIKKTLDRLKNNNLFLTPGSKKLLSLITELVHVNNKIWDVHDKLTDLNPDHALFPNLTQKIISLYVIKDDLLASAVTTAEALEK